MFYEIEKFIHVYQVISLCQNRFSHFFLFNISVSRNSDDNSCGDILLVSRTSLLRAADQF